MSDQLTSQSRSNESGISRRTALRGAAWSASAVTVVVATPNIAAATVTGTATGSLTRKEKTATGTTTFVNGPGVIAGGKLTVTITGGALAFTGNPPQKVPAGWNRVTARKFTYNAQLAAGGGAAFTVTSPLFIDLDNNGQAHVVTLTFTVDGLTLDELTFSFTTKDQTVSGV